MLGLSLKHDLPTVCINGSSCSLNWLISVPFSTIEKELTHAITHRAKTKPAIQARRGAALIGLAHEITNVQRRNITLDYIVKVLNKL